MCKISFESLPFTIKNFILQLKTHFIAISVTNVTNLLVVGRGEAN